MISNTALHIIHLSKLILQNRAARVITGADYRMATSTSDILSKLGWSSLKQKRNKQKALMMFKMNGMTSAYLEDILREILGDRFIILGSQDVI